MTGGGATTAATTRHDQAGRPPPHDHGWPGATTTTTAKAAAGAHRRPRRRPRAPNGATTTTPPPRARPRAPRSVAGETTTHHRGRARARRGGGGGRSRQRGRPRRRKRRRTARSASPSPGCPPCCWRRSPESSSPRSPDGRLTGTRTRRALISLFPTSFVGFSGCIERAACGTDRSPAARPERSDLQRMPSDQRKYLEIVAWRPPAGVEADRSSSTCHHLSHARKIPVAYGWSESATFVRVAPTGGLCGRTSARKRRPTRGDRALVRRALSRRHEGHGEVIGRSLPVPQGAPVWVMIRIAGARHRTQTASAVRQAAPHTIGLTSAGAVQPART